MTAAALAAGAMGILWAAAALDALPAASAVGQDAGPAAAPQARTPTPLCEISHDKRAGPPIASLGDTIEVTLTTSALCRAPRRYVHVVLVLDESDAMTGEPIRKTKAAARQLVDDLRMTDYPGTYVGVVGFADRARRLVGLTNEPDLVRRALHRVGVGSGAGRLDVGLEEALEVHARGGIERDPDWVTKLVITYSLGPIGDRCDEAIRASRQVRGAGILSIAVCAGPTCSERCLREIASSHRYYFTVEDDRIEEVLAQIRDRTYNVVVRSLAISDTLSSDMAYVPGSARPEPTAMDPSGRWLRWHAAYIPREGVTVTFRARPLRLGAVTTNEGAEGEAIINTGERHDWRFAVPTVVVVEPSPTCTATTTATATPRYVPATPPARRPTAEGEWALYVPVAARRCGTPPSR